MKSNKEHESINNWAYFYVYNVKNIHNRRYSIKYCAKMANCSINTMSRQIARIRMGYKTDYD